jgi:hypothetical protein
MIQYIYFLKCPNCEDEPFDFFDEAKASALSCLGSKPIITQVEVNRNDFGECTDSRDLGTIWSWEDEAGISADEPAVSVFTKGDFAKYNPDHDEEFNSLDNSLDCEAIDDTEFHSEDSLDRVPDNFRKPIPADMTIEQLVEAMEENEDTVECVCCQELHPKEDCKHDEKHGWICPDCADEVVECTWCEELYDRSECRYEVDLGWLCPQCEAAIKSRGEELTFREGLTETFEQEQNDLVELEYDDLEVSVFKGDRGDYEEIEYTTDYVFETSKYYVAQAIWEEFLTDEDVKELSGGSIKDVEVLNDNALWDNFFEKHFDTLVDKYYDNLLDFYRDAAREAYESDYTYSDYEIDRMEAAADAAHYDESYGSINTSESLLEKLEESDEYKKRLTTCPECGTERFDQETGICINCGFNIIA